jgi:hypothetical protein
MLKVLRTLALIGSEALNDGKINGFDNIFYESGLKKTIGNILRREIKECEINAEMNKCDVKYSELVI